MLLVLVKQQQQQQKSANAFSGTTTIPEKKKKKTKKPANTRREKDHTDGIPMVAQMKCCALCWCCTVLCDSDSVLSECPVSLSRVTISLSLFRCLFCWSVSFSVEIPSSWYPPPPLRRPIYVLLCKNESNSGVRFHCTAMNCARDTWERYISSRHTYGHITIRKKNKMNERKNEKKIQHITQKKRIAVQVNSIIFASV